ncbi:hypothetical protein, partial [Bradyrhizobium sp. 197]|uniref:hypothetical protein n=1 Tax=Bradyrhizobium sp. 197 TaxID=2782663 RepID=UPI001FFBFA5D
DPLAEDFVAPNPQRSLRGADDQSGLKLAFFTDDEGWPRARSGPSWFETRFALLTMRVVLRGR